MLPKYILRQMCMTGGNFSPKYPKFARPVPHYVHPYSATGAYVNGTNTTPVLLPPGNLLFESYRFFVGSQKPDVAYSQCRTCLQTLYTKESRKDHGKELGCCKIMVAALIEALKAGRCLICGFTTEEKKWGVPLCPYPKFQCQHVWCFLSAQPKPLRTLLKAAYLKRENMNVKIPRLDY